MPKQNDEQTQEIVDLDYVGIASFLTFLVLLWQHRFFSQFMC